jgi:hypothetical protein
MLERVDAPARPTFQAPFTRYELDAAYDELFDPGGQPRPQYRALYQRLSELPPEELQRRQQAADLSFLHQGITFTAPSASFPMICCRVFSPAQSGPQLNGG